jgi:hypothetical protein
MTMLFCSCEKLWCETAAIRSVHRFAAIQKEHREADVLVMNRPVQCGIVELLPGRAPCAARKRAADSRFDSAAKSNAVFPCPSGAFKRERSYCSTLECRRDAPVRMSRQPAHYCAKRGQGNGSETWLKRWTDRLAHIRKRISIQRQDKECQHENGNSRFVGSSFHSKERYESFVQGLRHCTD